MDFSDDVIALENMLPIEARDGLWNEALPIALTRSFHDTTRCKTFTEIIVTQGSHQYVIGTRLYLDDGEIIRIDSLVTDEGDWLLTPMPILNILLLRTGTLRQRLRWCQNRN